MNNPYMYDPVFPTTNFTASDVPGVAIPNADGWGLRVVNSSLLVYGAGLYSFFNNYSTTCSDQGNGEVCQSRIFSVEGSSVVYFYVSPSLEPSFLLLSIVEKRGTL